MLGLAASSPANKSSRGSRAPEAGVRGLPSPFINLDERGRDTPHASLLPLMLMRKDFLDEVLVSKQVVVIGGGVMGSALAYWLTRLDPASKITVVERDPSYEYASSALSAASIRQQFSTPVNIRISQASIAFLRNAPDELESGGDRPDIALREAGYLYLAGAGSEGRAGFDAGVIGGAAS